MQLDKFLIFFEKIYPKFLAEAWDKVGLMVCSDTERELKKIILANDLTLDVVKLAKSKCSNLILCYHPLIFSPLKKLTVPGSWQERVIIECIKSDISVYSFHTIVDNMKNGLNDHIARAFEFEVCMPIKPQTLPKYSLRTMLKPSTVTQELLHTCYLNDILFEFNAENSLECVWHNKTLFDYSELKLSSETIPSTYEFGSGRLVILKNPLSLLEIINTVKSYCSISSILYASKHDTSSMVSSIGICAGSGAAVLNGVACDLLITGEMSHHDVLKTIEAGKHVILTNHTNIENPFISDFASILSQQLHQLDITDIEIECAPLKDPLIVL